MPRRSAPRLAAAAAALVLAAGCSSDGDAPEAQASSSPPVRGGVTEQQRDELIERLGAVDPALGNGRSVGRARNVCLAISRGVAGAELAETVRDRFGTPGEELTDEQVTGITAAVRETLCPAEPSAAPTS